MYSLTCQHVHRFLYCAGVSIERQTTDSGGAAVQVSNLMRWQEMSVCILSDWPRNKHGQTIYSTVPDLSFYRVGPHTHRERELSFSLLHAPLMLSVIIYCFMSALLDGYEKEHYTDMLADSNTTESASMQAINQPYNTRKLLWCKNCEYLLKL